LAEAATDHVKAAGAAVVEVTENGGARVAAHRRVPDAVASWHGDADVIGGELGDDLLKHAEGRFARALVLPLVATGGLFGSLVLFFEKEQAATERKMQVARGLVDLAAIALERSAHIARLAQANAELRASREALARTEKLRALGQMAAGVSHDLKNILNPLSMHAQIIQRALAKGDTAQALATVEETKQVIRRGVETLERLRAFSRQSPDAKAEKVDLRMLAREAVAIARPRMASLRRPGEGGAALSRIVEDLAEVPPVVARGDEVVAAVVNLIVNAIDAMPEGGTITVTTRLEGGRACLTVADTGPGMPPEVQARVFEPFFTTKGSEGTGLGLAMVFATMQRYGGTVTLETAPGKGAAFTLSFPTTG
jgi:signal transduction histidine kinase